MDSLSRIERHGNKAGILNERVDIVAIDSIVLVGGVLEPELKEYHESASGESGGPSLYCLGFRQRCVAN